MVRHTVNICNAVHKRNPKLYCLGVRVPVVSPQLVSSGSQIHTVVINTPNIHVYYMPLEYRKHTGLNCSADRAELVRHVLQILYHMPTCESICEKLCPHPPGAAWFPEAGGPVIPTNLCNNSASDIPPVAARLRSAVGPPCPM